MNEEQLLEKYAAKTAGLRLDTFRPFVGDAFVHEDAAGKRYELILAEAEQNKRNQDLFDSFTLCFTSPRDVLFQQGHYLLEHKTMGEFPLFLVPTLSLDAERNSYYAYFCFEKSR